MLLNIRARFIRKGHCHEPKFSMVPILWGAGIAGLTGFVVTTPAWSQPEQFHHAVPCGEMWGRSPKSKVVEDLKVTPVQREQVQQIEAEMMSDVGPIHQSHHELMQGAVQLLRSPTIDEAAIEKSRQEMLTLHARLSEHLTTAFVQMRTKVLTPDQREQWAVHMREWIDRMGHHSGMGQPSSAASAPASSPAR